MESQHPNPPYTAPPPFSPPLNAQQRMYDPVKPDLMEIETVDDRTQRAASVLSGMSAEDMEAAETLKSLHKDIHSPKIQQVPPAHVQTRTSYAGEETEPLLSLITSQYPLAASVINSSLSIYKTAQSYTPGGEWTERYVGLPLARTTARISGVESGLRWALQPKRDSRNPNGTSSTADVEKGFVEISPDGVIRTSTELSLSEPLPAYNPGDRSPPYSEHSVALSRDRNQPPAWRQQLFITTSGLGVAMSEESLRSLRYCLSWLKWANSKLGGAIQTLRDLLRQWEQDPSNQLQSGTSQGELQQKQAQLTARIAALKGEVLQTLKKVVNIVSTYAGGALPNNARQLVHQQLVSLPQRFSIASSRSNSTGDNSPTDETANNANRVLVLAQEGLDMMNQVSRVVNDTLVSAEDWCEKLGRPRSTSEQQPSTPQLTDKSTASEERERSMTIGREALPLSQQQDEDVKMEM